MRARACRVKVLRFSMAKVNNQGHSTRVVKILPKPPSSHRPATVDSKTVLKAPTRHTSEPCSIEAFRSNARSCAQTHRFGTSSERISSLGVAALRGAPGSFQCQMEV